MTLSYTMNSRKQTKKDLYGKKSRTSLTNIFINHKNM